MVSPSAMPERERADTNQRLRGCKMDGREPRIMSKYAGRLGFWREPPPLRSLLLWRCNRMAVVRRVSGTFLFTESFLRSPGFRSGSMCRLTSRGVLELFIRLRTTA